MKISPARVAAFDALSRIEKRREFSSTVLADVEEGLSAKDRGLCHELVLGALRRQIYLDRLIDQLAKGKIDTVVRIALRLGIYQLLFLEKVPAYSAINESVNLVQRAKKTSAKGLVNAVLRRLSKEVPVIEYRDELDRLTVETSHPRWLLERWSREFGEEVAASIALANNVAPPIAFRAILPDAAADILRGAEPGAIAQGGFVSRDFTPGLREGAERGQIYFQDEASQLVAWTAAAYAGKRVIDVCAAPGGKTTLIAQLSGPDAFIVAGDVTSARVQLLKRTCEKQDAERVAIVQYDAELGLPFPDASFDTVFVDAPCTGTGTIRHNPEIRYFLTPEDVDELSLKQQRILKNASKLVRNGGNLVYSTCSLEREENETVCHAFLKENSDFSMIVPRVADRFLTADGFARTFPHRDGTDGFFIAGFERRG